MMSALKDTIKINSKNKDYNVIFDNQLLRLQEFSCNKNCIYLVDEKVWILYKDVYFKTLPDSQIIKIEAVEENKDYHKIGEIIQLLTNLPAKKNLTIVAIGGGIIQDISGFIASILYRGINWIYIPTTLLSQADSCIGAKTSINFGNNKNLVGTFWSPNEVWLSTKFIETLNTNDFYSGIGEIIKLFLIDGEKSLCKIPKMSTMRETDLRNNIVDLLKQSLLIKKGFIEIDEFDKGVRNILNFGHCVGHAIESVTNYAIPHGQAVTLGMIWANIISTKINLLSESKKNSVFNSYLINLYTLSKDLINFNPEEIVDAMKKDKKREGKDLAIILMDDNYTFNRIKDLKEEVISETYEEFISIIK